MSRLISRIPWPALGVVFAALSLAALAAAEEKPEAPSAVINPPLELSADLQTTLIDRSGHITISTVHIHRIGKLVRYENTQADPPEVSIMNFDQLKEYRIYTGDQIYFETIITNRSSAKAQREGLIPVDENPNIIEKRIVLREDTIEGHPTDIVLWIRSIKGRPEFGSDYTLLWEARDLNRQPLRVAYNQANLSLTIVDFRNVQVETIDATLLTPPSGFVNMSPF